jgi:putative ABC transport system permease protein
VPTGPGRDHLGRVQTLVEVGPALAAALVLLVALAVVVSRVGELGVGAAQATAALRAVVQLSAVALVITAVVRSLALSLLFVAGMYVVASVTAARRIVPGSSSGRWLALPVGAGALPVVALLLSLGVVPLEGVAVVPVAGIVVGGAMTATVLAGRRGRAALQERRGEVEAAVSLGLLPRDAAVMLLRPAAGEALVPDLDKTRTVGLVTLPGAFVGTLLGGATPVEAGAVQVLVLVALLAVQAVSVVLTVELLARGLLNADDPSPGRVRGRQRRGG